MGDFDKPRGVRCVNAACASWVLSCLVLLSREQVIWNAEFEAKSECKPRATAERTC